LRTGLKYSPMRLVRTSLRIQLCASSNYSPTRPICTCHGTHPHTFIPWHLRTYHYDPYIFDHVSWSVSVSFTVFAMSAILAISVILPISTISAPCTCWPSNQVNDIYPVFVLSYLRYPTSCILPCSYLYIALPVTTLFSTLHPAYANSMTVSQIQRGVLRVVCD